MSEEDEEKTVFYTDHDTFFYKKMRAVQHLPGDLRERHQKLLQQENGGEGIQSRRLCAKEERSKSCPAQRETATGLGGTLQVCSSPP